jgi:hypothetical protein
MDDDQQLLCRQGQFEVPLSTTARITIMLLPLLVLASFMPSASHSFSWSLSIATYQAVGQLAADATTPYFRI